MAGSAAGRRSMSSTVRRGGSSSSPRILTTRCWVSAACFDGSRRGCRDRLRVGDGWRGDRTRARLPSRPRACRAAPCRIGRWRSSGSAVRPSRRGVHLGLPDGGLAAPGRRSDRALRRTSVRDVTCSSPRGEATVIPITRPWAAPRRCLDDVDRVPDLDVALGVALMTARVPWHRAREVASIDSRRRLPRSMRSSTQIHPIGPDPADAAILPPHVLDRFRRTTELVFQ